MLALLDKAILVVTAHMLAQTIRAAAEEEQVVLEEMLVGLLRVMVEQQVLVQ